MESINEEGIQSSDIPPPPTLSLPNSELLGGKPDLALFQVRMAIGIRMEIAKMTDLEATIGADFFDCE